MANKGAGWRTIEYDGYEILVGKSARENDRLTFRIARPRDFWLHASGHAGSHVVIRLPEGVDDAPRAVIERAAELAAWHSKAREARGKIVVHLCRAGEVRKRKGAPAGQVQLRRYERVRVYPRGE